MQVQVIRDVFMQWSLQKVIEHTLHTKLYLLLFCKALQSSSKHRFLLISGRTCLGFLVKENPNRVNECFKWLCIPLYEF